MTRPERRREKKRYEKDFAAFCRITGQYFPDLVRWLQEVKDPQKFWTYETEVMLMTVIMKNICDITSMQKMTDEFLDRECVGNLCRILHVEPHEFLPHYVTPNGFPSRLETGKLERLRKNMVRAPLRRRKFEDARFPGKYWLPVFDATGLFHFTERHCPHCLRKVVNKGTAGEKEIYYHHVLEAKLVPGDGFVISIGTEFTENEAEDVSKNDCETKASKRLSERLKKEYPRLPVCVLADSLYASEPVFKRCIRENKWHILIRHKGGSIPSIAEEYRSMAGMGEAEELDKQIAREYPRKGRMKEIRHMEWVPDIDYLGYKLTLPAPGIETEWEKTGKKETKVFQGLTDLVVTGKNAGKFARVGRGRWQIENEGFNLQKNIRYDIQHVNSVDYNAMKCHYLLTQIADILL